MTYPSVPNPSHMRILLVMGFQTLVLAEGVKSREDGNLHLLGGRRNRIAAKKFEGPITTIQREGLEEAGIAIPDVCNDDMGCKILGSPIEHDSSQGERKTILGALVWIPFRPVAPRLTDEIRSLHLFDYPETWRCGLERMHSSHQELAVELFRRAALQYPVVPNRLTKLFKGVL